MPPLFGHRWRRFLRTPDVSDFSTADFKPACDIKRHLHRPLQMAPQVCAGFSAADVIRVRSDHDAGFPRLPNQGQQQAACPQRIAVPTIGWVNMIANVAEVIDAAAFSQPKLNLSHFPAFPVRGDQVIVYLAKPQFRWRWPQPKGNEVNDAVCIIRLPSSEPTHTSCTFT